ncbi:UvrD-helicase domain-containing protein [Luteolibacter sp. SL250]|uniref:UvrD-helicase domain-containing protein n=1 Tax=Luteolibacter sp. SL250 TaxID=2995170 RepID=UPI0022704B87|nr:UvrD-helicase domain-containing protein [Luteolibacter sp. SL250]WAC19044.1 UvrD-helicase domain-containing protein [Luteolibacter sp. SL250]
MPQLDDEKLEAIETTEGPLLVIAGPGSGKTRTLVERTVRLIQRGESPSSILVATFTEKAASELVTRISNRLLELELRVNLNEMWVGTLHSLFLRILDDHREFTRLKRNYRILDQFDQRYFVYRRINQFRESPHSHHLLNLSNTNGWSQAETVISYVNKVSEELLDPDALKRDGDGAIAAIGHLYDAYQRLTAEENLLDFSSIQVEAFHLLAQNPQVLAALQGRLRYLMIDEYQDTNTVQEKILLKLASGHSNLCVVGDDDQGLYRFRGATIRNILEFPSNFPPGTCKSVRLTTNYRSHPGIIGFYNEWMRHLNWRGDDGSQFRFDKEIKPRQGEFPETSTVIRVTTGGTQDDYHNEVLSFIRRLQESGKLDDLNQIAFLFRSVKSPKATALAHFLEANGVPVFSPRSALFFDREEVKLILGAIVFIFPNLFDLLKWDEKIELPVWGYYLDCKTTFANAIRADRKKHEGLLKWANLHAQAHLRLSAPTDYRFSQLMYELFQFPMFRSFLEADLNGRSYDLRATYNLALFSRLVTKFEYLHNIIVFTPDSLQKDLQAFFNRFLRFLIDGGIEEYEDFEELAPAGCVSFMTIHQSKGLEFPIVLVGSLEASPRKQFDDIDEALQSRYYHKPPFEPLDRTKFFDFWRLYYTAFSRPQNLLGLIGLEERNKKGGLKIPRKEFRPVYDGLPHWRSSAVDLSLLDFEKLKEPNIKHQYSFTSHVLLYENCPLQYKFFKELEFASVRQSGPMAGTLIHQTIEDMHKAILRGEEHRVTNEQVEEWFEANYRSLSRSERTYLAPGQLNALLEQVLRYKSSQEHDWSVIKAAEVDVSLVKEDYILHGTIDLVQGADGTVEIVDFKSGKKPDLNFPGDRAVLERYRRQLEVYAHLIEEREGLIVSRMHLYYTSEKNGIPTISYDRAGADIAKTIATFDRIVSHIEARDYDMSNTVKTEKLCGNCDMYLHCNPIYPYQS